MNNMLSLDKRLELWEQTLEPDKLVLIAHAVKTEVSKLDELINTTLDNCYGAAIGDYTDLSIKEIQEIVKKSYEYMEDSKKFINESGLEWMNKIAKVEENVKQFLRKEMVAGTVKSEAMCKAKKEFGIPAKDISNLWMIVKEEDYPEKCINNGDNQAKGKIQNKAKSEEKEVKGKTIQEDKKKSVEKEIDKQKEDIKTNLVEITEVRKFKGQFGEYEKSGSGIKTGDITFKDVKDIEESKAEVEAEIKTMREDFEKAISEKRIKAFGKLNEVMELLSM